MIDDEVIDDQLHMQTILAMAGGDLIKISGFLSALSLTGADDWRVSFQISQARMAIANASAAIDAYEAADSGKEAA